MKKIIAGLAVLASFSSFAEGQKAYTQDVYLALDVAKHELEFDGLDLDVDGNRFGLLFGARNVFSNGLFYGGEIQASLYDNDSDSNYLEENYGYGASASVGKQFNTSESFKLNLYGLLGYSAIRSEVGTGTESFTLDGLQWGGGIDTNISDWMLGVRYTQTNLDGNYDEENISLVIGHKLAL